MANGRGGKRPGAGRKLGSPNRRTKEVAAKALEDGVTPIEVMLACMREAFDAGDSNRAVEYAKAAAPYCHPRLANAPQDVQQGDVVLNIITGIERDQRDDDASVDDADSYH